MPASVREALSAEMLTARPGVDRAARCRAAERAHILSQPWAWPHTRVNAIMLRLSLREHDRRHALGQAVRLLVDGPGSLTGRHPTGNTGSVNVGLTETMPIPDDLDRLLTRAGNR